MTFETFGDYEARVRAGFAAQGAMETMGMQIDSVAPGEVRIAMPFDARLGQQHGFLHAGVITSGMDTACGFAALSLMPEDAGVLTIELKTSLMAPGKGERFEYSGRVVKPGRNVMFTEGVAVALDGSARREIARLSATMMVVRGREGIKG